MAMTYWMANELLITFAQHSMWWDEVNSLVFKIVECKNYTVILGKFPIMFRIIRLGDDSAEIKKLFRRWRWISLSEERWNAVYRRWFVILGPGRSANCLQPVWAALVIWRWAALSFDSTLVKVSVFMNLYMW